MEFSQNKRIKKSTNKICSENLRSRNEALFGPLVLGAMSCNCGDNRHKLQTSFKLFVSKKAVTWWFDQTCV